MDHQKRNVLQAINPARRVGLPRAYKADPLFEPTYPVVPPQYPNRSLQRLMRRGRVDLLPDNWRKYVALLSMKKSAQETV